jgi:hypothetical protein
MRFSFPDIDVSDTYTYIHTYMYVCMHAYNYGYLLFHFSFTCEIFLSCPSSIGTNCEGISWGGLCESYNTRIGVEKKKQRENKKQKMLVVRW